MHPEAARLAFRDMTPEDIDDMAALLGDPDVMTYYPRPKTRRVAEKIGLRPEKRTTVHGGRDVIIYAAALG